MKFLLAFTLNLDKYTQLNLVTPSLNLAEKVEMKFQHFRYSMYDHILLSSSSSKEGVFCS